MSSPPTSIAATRCSSMARMEEALASYDDALALEPENAEANFNAALTRLCLGDFRRRLEAI